MPRPLATAARNAGAIPFVWVKTADRILAR
jgi:hypothetical protein